MRDCMKLCIARDQCTHTAELLGLLSFYIDYTHTWLVLHLTMFHEDFKQYSFAVQWFWCFSHITSNYHSCPQTTPPSSLGLSHHLCAKAHQTFGMLTLIYIIIVIRPLYCHYSLAPVHLCLKHVHACPVWSSHTTKFITCGLRLVMLGVGHEPQWSYWLHGCPFVREEKNRTQ